MARSPLTLAALATAAVGGLDVVSASRAGDPGLGDFDSALLTGKDGKNWVVRVPRSPAAEVEQAADLGALRALSSGVRARLPFAVQSYAGQAPFGGTRAVVYEFVHGDKVSIDTLSPGLAAGIGEAIAAIHNLPATFISDAGLAARSTIEQVTGVAELIDRAEATGRVPGALLGRWLRASEDASLWQYTPAVVNGTLGSHSFLAEGTRVTGVLDWHGLRIDDPAIDLQWILGTPDPAVADAAFDAYARVRSAVDRRLRDRARLLAELELARWLLHGVQVRDDAVIDDAVAMMSTLVDELSTDARAPITAPVPTALSVDEVEELLEHTPRAS